MVELILVMVIAGILAAVAIPRFMGRNSFDTRGFTDQLAATVRFAQKLAISQRTPVFVQFTATDATLCYVARRAVRQPCTGTGWRETLHRHRTEWPDDQLAPSAGASV